MEGYAPLPLTSLYVGDLSPEVTEDDLRRTFSQVGHLISVRLCRDKLTHESLCYGYVNFLFPSDASIALHSLNHVKLMGRSMRVMYSQRDPICRKNGAGNLFVKNLDRSVTSYQLHQIFANYGDVISCKVAEENGMSKGFGFVQFHSEDSAVKAIDALHGSELGCKKLYVAKFMKKEARTTTAAKTDSSLKSLLVRKLDKSLTENHLRDKFCEYGKIQSVFVMKDDEGKSKGFGFINFESQDSAVNAMKDANGAFLGSKRISLCLAMSKAEREFWSKALGKMQATVCGDKPCAKTRDRQVYNNNRPLHHNFPQHWPTSYQGYALPTTTAHMPAQKFHGGAYYSQPMLSFPASYHGFVKGKGYIEGPLKNRKARMGLQTKIVEGGNAGRARNSRVRNLQPGFEAICDERTRKSQGNPTKPEGKSGNDS